jgi:hypothetical protein
MTSILESKKEMEDILLGIEEVQGVGISEDRNHIIVYVSEVNEKLLELIPNNIAGYPVLIKQVGILKPAPDFVAMAADPERLWRYRPVVGGISTGHYAVTAGTIGCIVQDEYTDKPLFLSNNHVYANVSFEGNPRAQVSDPVLNPGPFDGGKIEDTIGTLNRWIPLKTTSTNVVDCAVANASVEASPYILGENSQYIEVKGLRTVTQGINVKKAGRTSGFTRGQIIDTDFTGIVDYNGQQITFSDQLLVMIKIEGGDSGSLLLDDEDNAVGLLFAGGQDDYGNYFGVANKINTVFSLLNIELPSGEQPGPEPEPSGGGILMPVVAMMCSLMLVGVIMEKK